MNLEIIGVDLPDEETGGNGNCVFHVKINGKETFIKLSIKNCLIDDWQPLKDAFPNDYIFLQSEIKNWYYNL